MVAIKPESPGTFKKMLELHGFRVIDEDVYNWLMASADDDIPIVVPKLGDTVDIGIMMNILDKASIDNMTYFLLRDRAVAAIPPETLPN